MLFNCFVNTYRNLSHVESIYFNNFHAYLKLVADLYVYENIHNVIQEYSLLITGQHTEWLLEERKFYVA